MPIKIPFNRPYSSPKAHRALGQLLRRPELVGDGTWGHRCEQQLNEVTGCRNVLLTPSATAALELSMLALGVGPGDEVILPSFAFSSCANAVALRGAVPVFCDVRPDTMCADLECIKPCLTARTRAVMILHYGGNVADMHPLLAWCKAHELTLVEDAAQAIGASLDGQAAGTFGSLGAVSFHETKNIGAGEAGALLINDERLRDLIAIHRDKGTDRLRFLRGEVEKYSWQSLGSSWVVSELVSAYLSGQLEDLDTVNSERRRLWQRYHAELETMETHGFLLRPGTTFGAVHNGHCFYVILPGTSDLKRVQAGLLDRGIQTVRHYAPLHESPAGQRYGRTPVSLDVTDSYAERLLRLPIWPGLKDEEQDFIIESLQALVRAT